MSSRLPPRAFARGHIGVGPHDGAAQCGREALTRHVVKTWLDKDRFRHLNHLVKGSENPEYRIAVDVRIATDAPIDLALAFFGGR